MVFPSDLCKFSLFRDFLEPPRPLVLPYFNLTILEVIQGRERKPTNQKLQVV